MTRPPATIAAEFLVELGYIEALDASDPENLVLLWSDFGLHERERAMLLLELALDSPVVGEAAFRMFSGENAAPISPDLRGKVCDLLAAQRAVQKANVPKEAKPAARNPRLP